MLLDSIPFARVWNERQRKMKEASVQLAVKMLVWLCMLVMASDWCMFTRNIATTKRRGATRLSVIFLTTDVSCRFPAPVSTSSSASSCCLRFTRTSNCFTPWHLRACSYSEFDPLFYSRGYGRLELCPLLDHSCDFMLWVGVWFIVNSSRNNMMMPSMTLRFINSSLLSCYGIL